MAEFTKHLYLSMVPEALIASQLSPEQFGVYYAVGSVEKSRGQAIFFELDPSFRHEELPVEEGLERCHIHEDGSPKRSVYISVYRALERIPLDAILKLYLVTQDGRVLGIEPSATCPEDTAGLHLYQEIAPVHPLVVSVGNLPYGKIDHLRQCLVDLRTKTVHSKMVDRVSSASFPYRTLRMGLFLGNRERLMCFPMPSQEELRSKHYRWWRSADM